MARRRFTSILITGASGGIGAALALATARPGISLALTGRDHTRLADVANACRAAGAMVCAASLDVRDAAAMRTQLLDWDAACAFDLLVANAGIAAPGLDGAIGIDALRLVTDINVGGMVNLLEPLLPRLVARGSGQIGLMSSLAGFRGMPPAAAYCASKAWARVYGEALRLSLAPHGIGVSVICPGFVATPMTADNSFPMPLLMSPARAADIILRGLAANRGRIAFPRRLLLAVRLLESLPIAWTDWLISRLVRSSAPGDAPAAR
jgi:short-subunit dehydrogenase